MLRTMAAVIAASSVVRYWRLLSSTLPETGPSTRAQKRPWRLSREMHTPRLAQWPISGGREPGRTKADNASKQVHGHAAAFGAVDFDNCVLTILV